MIPLWHTRNSKIKGTAYNYQVTVISTKYMDSSQWLQLYICQWCWGVLTDHWRDLSAGGDCWWGWALHEWPSGCERSRCECQIPSQSPSQWSLPKRASYFSVIYRIFELFCHNENFTETMSMTIRLFSCTLSTSSPLTHLFFTESTECR